MKKKDVILVVDDQPNNLKVIAGTLSGEYAISFANNGKNALKMLEKQLPNLILLDIMMPEMDGFEVCKRIKKNFKAKDIPVVFLTAKTDLDDIIKGFSCGAVDYITKPFSPEEMKIRVKNHLNLFHAKNEINRMFQKLLISEKELKNLNLKLEKSNNEKDKFFSIIAHDLRSPFTAINGLSELLLKKIKNNDLKGIEQYSELILQSSQKSLGLLSNLMSWAQSQTGRLELSPEYLSIAALVNETMALFSDATNHKSLVLTNNVSPNIQALADKDMISTVLRNLIANAVKFTPPGGSITITAESKQGEVITFISDTGIGMNNEIIKNLFRLDKNTGRSGTGGETSTGLGLVLCKEFIEKHGGNIRVESKEGFGSVFSFSLPA